MVRFFNTFFFTTVLIFSNLSHASNNVNVLIVGQDANDESIARYSPIYQRVIDALSNQFHDKQFNVYDETVLTHNEYSQGRTRRSDAEIIEVVRAINNPPIDIVVLFSIYTHTIEKSYSKQIKSRIEARLINIKTGKHLGNFEVDSGKGWQGSVNCNHQCLLENIGDKTRVLANDLGAILADKLTWMFSGKAPKMMAEYNLIFDGYNMDDFAEIEEYLVIFSGYQSHRPVDIRYTRTEVWYQSAISVAKLTRNLNKMLGELKLRARITFSGNTFIMKKITFRGQS